MWPYFGMSSLFFSRRKEYQDRSSSSWKTRKGKKTKKGKGKPLRRWACSQWLADLSILLQRSVHQQVKFWESKTLSVMTFFSGAPFLLGPLYLNTTYCNHMSQSDGCFYQHYGLKNSSRQLEKWQTDDANVLHVIFNGCRFKRGLRNTALSFV